jgi:hypothetical protein
MVDTKSQFGGFLTTIGAAQKTNADALGLPWRLSHMLIGDAKDGDPVPNPNQKALVNQVYRAPLNQLYVSPTDANVLIAELMLPPNIGGWWIRELGLEDENGNFCAVANCAPSYKPLLVQNSGRNQVVRMHVITGPTANIELKVDPSVVLATRGYADSLITAHTAHPNPHPQYQLRGAVSAPSASTALTANQEGLVVLSAEPSDRTYTLPLANAALGVREFILRRTDTTTNTLTIACAGTDKIINDTLAVANGHQSITLSFAGDYVSLRSDTNGKWWVVASARPINGVSALINVQMLKTPGNFTYTPTPGTRKAIVKVQGAGSAGAGALATQTGQISVGAGGGSGGYAESFFSDAQALLGTPIVVGTGGASVEAAAGNAGGTSSFGTLMSATGASSSFIPIIATSTTSKTSPGTVGGWGAGGNLINSPGGTGGNAFATNGSGISGNGASSPLAAGGNQRTVLEGPGVPGLLGSGGSGGISRDGAPANTGGRGGDGVVIIEEYA